MVTDDVDENFNWISWKKKKQKKNTIGLRRTNDFESGPKICMNFQRQFYNNHLFVTVSLILILHLMFTSRFFNIGNPKWTPGMKKGKVYIWNRTLISGCVFPSKPLYISPRPWHIVKSSWTVFVLHISHPWNFDKLSLLLLFFSLSNQTVFHPLFLITKKFYAIVPLQNYPVFPSRMTIPHQLIRGVACDIIYHFVTRRLKKLFDSGV